VSDDGIGFDSATSARLLEDGHFGLTAMREQVQMVGGWCDINSRAGAGTMVIVTIPTAVSS